MTYRFKTHEARDIDGFIRTLVSNGYRVSFREGGNARVLMCDVSDDKCVIRKSKNAEVDEATRARFDGICPYSGRHCDAWTCKDCEVEKEERELYDNEREDDK